MNRIVFGLIGIFVLATIFAASFGLSVYAESNCAGVKTSYFSCPTGSDSSVQDSNFWKFLETSLNILLGLVGILAVGGIVYGAIMYSSAQDNENQVGQAKGIIQGVVVGLVAFIAMYAFFQYLIPGGVFS